MDPRRFDTLARSLTTSASRRSALAGLIAGLFAPLIPDRDAEAKRRHRRGKGKNPGYGAHGASSDRVGEEKKGKKKKKKKTCKNGAIKCSKVCVNTRNNALHCGGCGQQCVSNVACVDGACQFGAAGCPSNQILCAGLCVDPQDNEEHCGGCHNACTGDLTCINGECACAADTKCGNQCVDSQTDPDHCNGCSQACGVGESCDVGQCTLSTCTPNCSGGQTCQVGACACPAGTESSCGSAVAGECYCCPIGKFHCGGGACHECCIGADCGGGGRFCDRNQGNVCRCPNQQEDCGGICRTCCTTEHCAAIGREEQICGVNNICVCPAAGASECPKADFTGYYCADLNNDESNCGECGRKCLGSNCINKVCTP